MHGHEIDEDEDLEFGHGPSVTIQRGPEPDDVRQEVVHLRRRVRELEAQLAPLVARRAVDPHDPDGGDDDLECPHKGRIAAYYLRREIR